MLDFTEDAIALAAKHYNTSTRVEFAKKAMMLGAMRMAEKQISDLEPIVAAFDKRNEELKPN